MWSQVRTDLLSWVSRSLAQMTPTDRATDIKAALDSICQIQRLRPGDAIPQGAQDKLAGLARRIGKSPPK